MANNTQTKSQESINLLLVGWSGNGKSATGNSILNDKVFKRNISTETQDANIRKESRTVNGKNVCVVDGINLALARSDGTCDTDKITGCLNQALKLCDGRLSALLIILTHGIEFSKEEAEALKVVKKTLGQDVLSDIGICVISQKDNFLRALDEGEFNGIKQWRDMQTERMKELFNECKGRLVFFDNNTTSEAEKTKQKRELFDYVHQVSSGGNKTFLQPKHQPPEESKKNTVNLKSLQLTQMITEIDKMRQKLVSMEAAGEPDAGQSLRAFKKNIDDLGLCLSEGLSQVQSLRCNLDENFGIAKSNSQPEAAIESSKPKVEKVTDELENIKERIRKFEEEPTLLMKEIDSLRSKLQKDDKPQNQGILVEIFNCKQKLNAILSHESGTSSGLFKDEVVTKRPKTDDSTHDNRRTRTDDRMDTSNGTSLTTTIPGVKETVIQRPDSIDLLLVGRPGNGRSATGNSILGKPVFKRSNSASEKSDTASRGFTIETVEANEQRILVIDGPGLDASDEKSRKMIAKLLEESLGQFSYEFSALLIVLKFGERFTQADTKAVKLIKSVLGENIVRDHSICVITHGDNFDRAAKEASKEGQQMMSIESWCKNQTGEAKFFFEECKFRCVLYDNVTMDDSKKKDQLESLISFAKVMKKYTKADFKKAGVNRAQLLAEAKLPELKKESEELIESIGKAMKNMELEPLKDFKSHKDRLDDMHRKLDAHKSKVTTIGGNYKSFEQLIISANLCQQRVRTKIKMLLVEKREAEDAPNQSHFYAGASQEMKIPENSDDEWAMM